VNLHITISRYSYIDGFNESIGSASARFERSTLRCYKGTRTLVLRLLKIIIPVKCVIPLYDGFIAPPEEGELCWRNPPKRKNVKLDQLVWSINIDKRIGRTAQSLRLLWDATDILLSK
jgi:hypothetical protein